MTRYEFAASLGLKWLALLGGAGLLVACRRRAPRAAIVVLPFVLLLALPTGSATAGVAVRWQPPGWLAAALDWGYRAGLFGLLLVGPVAAMSARGGGRDGR